MLVIWSLERSTVATLFEPALVTYTFLPSPATSIQCGCFPIAMLRIAAFAAGLKEQQLAGSLYHHDTDFGSEIVVGDMWRWAGRRWAGRRSAPQFCWMPDRAPAPH